LLCVRPASSVCLTILSHRVSCCVSGLPALCVGLYCLIVYLVVCQACQLCVSDYTVSSSIWSVVMLLALQLQVSMVTSLVPEICKCCILAESFCAMLYLLLSCHELNCTTATGQDQVLCQRLKQLSTPV